MNVKRTKEWAIAELSAWLASPLEFGQPPAETEVWMHKALPWFDGNVHDCFLIRFKMADGYESVGFTGPVTWAFFQLPMSEIGRLRKGTRLRDLTDLFAGWYLGFLTVQQDAKAAVYDPTELAARIGHLQRRTERQIPVNLVFKDYLRIGKETLWVLEGDLLYNEKTTVLPAEGELKGIEIIFAGAKEKKRLTWASRACIFISGKVQPKGLVAVAAPSLWKACFRFIASLVARLDLSRFERQCDILASGHRGYRQLASGGGRQRIKGSASKTMVYVASRF
jgi:hypothetical protein